MHSIYQDKILKCSNCGEEFGYPLCDTYEYEGVDRIRTGLPITEVGYCKDCNRFVCIQKSLKFTDVSMIIGVSASQILMHGRDSVDSCVICGGRNLIYKQNLRCPLCGIGKMDIKEMEKEDDAPVIRFHFRRNIIKPVLRDVPVQMNYAEVETKNERHKIKKDIKKGNTFADYFQWIGILPVSVVAWVVVYWIVNLLYNVFSPVEMSQWAITLFSSGGSGFAFVYAGSLIAPKGNKIVSIVLATIMCVFSMMSFGFAVYGYGGNSILISIVSVVSTVAGCVFACMQIHENFK